MKHPVEQSRSELEHRICLLKSELEQVEKELANRREDDSYRWGFWDGKHWHSWDTFDLAVSASETHFGEGHGKYQVVKVYNIK